MEMNDTSEVLREQIIVIVDGTIFVINHIFNGTKNIREIYEDFIKRKLANSQ